MGDVFNLPGALGGAEEGEEGSNEDDEAGEEAEEPNVHSAASDGALYGSSGDGSSDGNGRQQPHLNTPGGLGVCCMWGRGAALWEWGHTAPLFDTL
jgi:hypothetical protein